MRNQRKKKSMNVIHTLIEVLAELLYRFEFCVVEELNKIAVFIQVCIPVFLVLIYFFTGVNLIQIFLLSCLLNVLVKYIREVGNRLNHKTEDGIPIPYHRFTRKDSNGFVDIRDDEMNEAIVYLCDVEDYLKSKGWL